MRANGALQDKELKLARMLVSLAAFSAVTLLSGVFTVTMLKFSADMLGSVVAATPVKTTNLRPGYVPRLPTTVADDFNAAKTVRVVPASTVATSPPAVSIPRYTHKVAVQAVKVRSGPGKTSPQVFTLRGGRWVNIGETVRGWVLVTDEAGRQGWVYRSLLQGDDDVVTAEATLQ
jgi:uncharacterized protein YgiM (DUF1202 family)